MATKTHAWTALWQIYGALAMSLALAGVGLADAPGVGDPAPSFASEAADGQTINLEQFRGDKRVVLYFYPKDETPGCTREACAFRDDWQRFAELDTTVLGISLDDAEAHRRFAENHKLPFPLLVDPEGLVAARYGVARRGDYLNRSTFLIDRRGVIRYATHEVKIAGQNQRLLELIAGIGESDSANKSD